MIERADLIRLVRASRAAGRHDFARSIAADWLAAWPGDHEVQLLLGEIEVAQGQHAAAAKRLHAIVIAHPLFQQAYGLLGHAMKASGDPNRAAVFMACGRALQNSDRPFVETGPHWVASMARARLALQQDNPREAVIAAQETLSADPDLPLPTLMLARALLLAGETDTATATARSGHDRWPLCVPFRILMADDLLSKGDIGRGVEYFHQAVADDPLGFSASSLLGGNHPYRDLWPDEMRAPLSRPVPADVSAALGDNLLVIPETKSSFHETISPALIIDPAPGKHSLPAVESAPYIPHSEVEVPPGLDEEEALSPEGLPIPKPWEGFRGPDSGDSHATIPPDEAQSLQQEPVSVEPMEIGEESLGPDRDDRRVPAYIVLSSRTRMMQAFGDQGFEEVSRAADELVEAVRSRERWTAYRIYIDDPQSLNPFGLGPVDPGNAWQIKLRLADIDRVLSQRGEMIGALLIVGGDGIVPFHMLPNPTDDDDDAVPSDNPYATADENYFAPQWPVGRLPINDDPKLLIGLLLDAADHHDQFQQPLTWLERIIEWVLRLFRGFSSKSGQSLGYSASIWRKASLAVFKSIGESERLITSPPVQSGELPPAATRPVSFSYFNLHGLEDAPEWFGQRDPVRDTAARVEFPIALHPQDVVNGGRAPVVVFTEACYGANSIGKNPETALCLKFLQSGSDAVIGSTKVSYGSVTPPLIAADLLGRLFWDQLNKAFPVGEALRRAKLQLIAHMYSKQEYLDGEDQKTLISFVLYGDPLFTPDKQDYQQGQKTIEKQAERPRVVKTACAIGGRPLSNEDLDPATLGTVKSIVARYLPGMVDADYRIHHQRSDCPGDDHTCPTHQLGIKSGIQAPIQKTVVTLAKRIPEGTRQHTHYARLTLDSAGKVLKLAVSR